MPEWIDTVLIAGGLLFGIGYLGWVFGVILEAYFEIKKVNAFKQDFEKAVKHSEPSWEEMKEIVRTNNLAQSRVLGVFQNVMKKILTGEAQELEQHKDLIRSYIEKHNEEEPFEGMPSEVRIHLERLREKIEDRAALLDPLTAQIKDLLAMNEKDRKHQKYYTMGGFFVGIFGLLFAAFTYFSTPETINPTPMQQESTTNNQINKDAAR